VKKLKQAVILGSGGLDSVTCLAIAKSSGFACHVLSFDYGQKQRAELNAMQKIAAHYEVPHKIIQLGIGELGGSALTDSTMDVPDYEDNGTIPVTYVPARNTIFLSVALGFAETIGAMDIFIGVSSVDYSGYPDCRPEYIEAFQKLANLATKVGVSGEQVKINTPLIVLSKAETIQKGISLGVDYSQTVSCYQADKEGRACGRCDACILRKKGFEEAGVVDPTCYYSEKNVHPS
jgi:7-cyano-7-deazaguanine synthase